MPWEILALGRTLEPIDNDLIVAGRRFVMEAKATCLLRAVVDSSHPLSYSLAWVVRAG